MEIIRGSLDDISRPASSDQTSSRASSLALPHSDRMGRITPFSLVVLTKDDADIEVIDVKLSQYIDINHTRYF